MIGGAGADSIYFHFGNGIISSGHDILRDTPANLNGDQVWGFGSGFTSTVDIQGVQFKPGRPPVSGNHQSTTLSSDGATALLNGLFTNGEFMIDTRGSGDQEHTAVASCSTCHPDGRQGRNSSVLNGVGNQPFLTGDGSVRSRSPSTRPFRHSDNAFATTRSAPTARSTTRACCLATRTTCRSDRTVDLGTPQQRAHRLLPDPERLRQVRRPPQRPLLLSPSTHLAANLNSSSTPVLLSVSQGTLTAAQIFHSFDSLNPGSAPQVLSGVSPGSHDLQIGFEDLQKRPRRQRLPGRRRQHPRLARLPDRLKTGSSARARPNATSLLSRRAGQPGRLRDAADRRRLHNVGTLGVLDRRSAGARTTAARRMVHGARRLRSSAACMPPRIAARFSLPNTLSRRPLTRFRARANTCFLAAIPRSLACSAAAIGARRPCRAAHGGDAESGPRNLLR